MVTATLDVTGHKEVEAALRDSEERFRHCFELGLIGMALTSPEKGFIAVNDEMCRILGYERSELLSETWANLTDPDDLAADVVQFERRWQGSRRRGPGEASDPVRRTGDRFHGGCEMCAP